MKSELDRSALERDIRRHTRRSVIRTLFAIVLGIGAISSVTLFVVQNLSASATEAQTEAIQQRKQAEFARAQAAAAKAESERLVAVNGFFEWLIASQEVTAKALRLSLQVGLLSSTAQTELANRAKADMNDQDFAALTMEALGSNGPLLQFITRHEKVPESTLLVISQGSTGTSPLMFQPGDNPIVDLAIPSEYESRYAQVSIIDPSGRVTNILDGSVLLVNSAAWTQSAEVAGLIESGFVRLTWSLEATNGGLRFTIDDSDPRGAVIVTALLSNHPFIRRPFVESFTSFLESLEELDDSGTEVEAVIQTFQIVF